GVSCSRDKADGLASASFAVNNAPKIGQFVLYGERSVKIGTFSRSAGGDIGVRAAAPASFGPQLKIGAQDTVDTRHNLLSPSVSLGRRALVGDVQTDALTDDGAIHGTVAPFPAASMPPGPLAPGRTPGSQAVIVSQN